MINKLLITLLMSFALTLSAKDLPIERTVKVGKLKNGMTYAIKKNAKPKGMAEFRLLVKVGSLDEDDDQKGLAHFVEHMAFNGSKNFKKNELIEHLESIGVTFGSHLNASTSYERTLYQLSIPVKNDNIKKSFLVFEDWAANLSFAPEEFDKERGVILEEARSRDNVRFRLFNQVKELTYGESKYLDRTPIGDMDIVKNVDVSVAKRFYDDWYRPELMHFVAVGDFDEKQIEQLIQKHFAKLTNNSKRKLAKRFIPAKKYTRIKAVSDPEATSNFFEVQYLEELETMKKEDDLRQGMVESMVAALFNMKSSEQVLKANPKATSIAMKGSSLGSARGGYKFSVKFNGLNEIAALKELYEMVWSFEKYGFSKEDFELIKKRLHNANENIYKRVHSQESSKIAGALASSELSGNVYIDYKVNYELKKKFIDEITLDEIHKQYKEILKIKDRVILFINTTGNQISKRAVLKTIKKAKENAVDLTKEKKLPVKLLKQELKAKKIISKKHNEKYDFYEYELENGIKVVFKKMDYIKNSISLKGFSFGGNSLYDVKDLNDAKKTMTFISKSGAGDFSIIDLSKMLSGKSARVKTHIGGISEAIDASSTANDVQTMFELLYLKVTQPKIDNVIVENTKELLKYKIKESKRSPSRRFNEELAKEYGLNHPRIFFDTAKTIDALDTKNMLNIYKDRFADMNNFNFIIVGDIEPKKIEEMISKYLANLPTKQRKESFVDRNIDYKKGRVDFVRYYNSKNISNVSVKFKGELKYDLRSSLELGILRSILSVRLREYIREEKSGVYGISVKKSLSRFIDDEASMTIGFSCDPKRKDELLSYVYKQIEDIKQKGVTQEELDIYNKKFTTSFETRKKTPKYWMSLLSLTYNYGDNIEDHINMQDIISSIKQEDIKKMANIVFDKDILETQLNPKSMKK